MTISNLTEYRDAYSKTAGGLLQYYRDERAQGNNGNAIDFPANGNKNILFNFKQKMIGKTENGSTKDVGIMVSLKCLSNFWRILEILLTNCEISLQLKWSKNCISVAGTAANQNPYFKITDTNLYVSVVSLSAQDKINLLKQLESGFKRTINWNKFLPKTTNHVQNRYLDFLIDPSFQERNRYFVLSFKDEDGSESHKQYYFRTAEIKDYNVMIDGRNFFDKPIKNYLKTCDNIRKIATSQGDDYTTRCLLAYRYFKNYYKLIAIDLSKQQKLDADPEAIQQIIFFGNLSRAEGAAIFFIIEGAKETVLHFLKGTLKVL